MVYSTAILQTYLSNLQVAISENSVMENLKLLLLSFIKKSLERLKVKKPVLGIGRMKIVEILFLSARENILNFREMLGAEPKFFQVVLGLCRSHPYNNILHNEVSRILELVLREPEDSKLLKSVPTLLCS
jgi:hypothetical protein